MCITWHISVVIVPRLISFERFERRWWTLFFLINIICKLESELFKLNATRHNRLFLCPSAREPGNSAIIVGKRGGTWKRRSVVHVCTQRYGVKHNASYTCGILFDGFILFLFLFLPSIFRDWRMNFCNRSADVLGLFYSD